MFLIDQTSSSPYHVSKASKTGEAYTWKETVDWMKTARYATTLAQTGPDRLVIRFGATELPYALQADDASWY